jgi:hypothetical protein
LNSKTKNIKRRRNQDDKVVSVRVVRTLLKEVGAELRKTKLEHFRDSSEKVAISVGHPQLLSSDVASWNGLHNSEFEFQVAKTPYSWIHDTKAINKDEFRFSDNPNGRAVLTAIARAAKRAGFTPLVKGELKRDFAKRYPKFDLADGHSFVYVGRKGDVMDNYVVTITPGAKLSTILVKVHAYSKDNPAHELIRRAVLGPKWHDAAVKTERKLERVKRRK